MKGKKILLPVAAILVAIAAMAQTSASQRLPDALASHPAPSADFLLGDWHYDDNTFVFFKEPGSIPSKERIDNDLALMTVNPENCELIFLDGKTCSFRVGNKKFKVDWKLNEETREFKAIVGLFSVKGYLVQDGDRLALIYSKANLEMMMRYLCPISTHKHINDLCKALEQTKGLTLCIIFKKD